VDSGPDEMTRRPRESHVVPLHLPSRGKGLKFY
jgi:hypothetical protein